jgi:DNA polymerase III subunit gamma/tau
MATQALYRRYRPRRFSEVRGQEHIVKALRNAVINHREGQAYLFSGPRGTGKTTSARILAKVLNCERSVDGEPCCECDSCLAVERGTSYDVHELDAASNNGVDAMRDLIEKASLGTPGRHKVYILDEVHMLSKAAEAALLKTLEEPPPHVVFVLATTDPQKVSDTIRSRTQHLRFHLLPMDELEQHIRWVAADAGLPVSDAAILAALEQGGGSARDTLSALELLATTGGDDVEVVQYGEFIESLIELDPGRALAAVAFGVQQGRDPRALTEDVIRYLRDCFLSLMAPELVALPDSRAVVVAEQASRLGAGKLVKAMERLGEILVEMRHSPDPRLLLEVALVQLTHQAAAHDIGALMDRIERLEQALADGGSRPVAAASTPVDPATGRVPLGARARRDATGPMARPTPAASTPAASTPAASTPAARTPPQTSMSSDPAPREAPLRQHDAAPAPVAVEPAVAPAGPAAAVVPEPDEPAAPPSAGASASPADQALVRWGEIVPTLKPLVRAIYSVPKMLGVRNGSLTLGAPNEAHRLKCEQHRTDVEAAAAAVVGAPVPIAVVTDASARPDDRDLHDLHDAREAPEPDVHGTAPTKAHVGGDVGAVPTSGPGGPGGPVIELHPTGSHRGGPPADDEIDLDDLVDAPPDFVVSPIDRLAQAFPGSELMDEQH